VFAFNSTKINALAKTAMLLVAAAAVTASAQSSSAIKNQMITLVCAQQRYFGTTSNLSNNSDAPFRWLVAGVEGGNGQVGRITAAGLYTAPQTAPDAPVEIEAVDRATGKTAFKTQVTVADNPAVSETHERWLAGAKDAAAEHGCDENLVIQDSSETVDDAVKLYLQVAGEHTCLILQPVSENPDTTRYSIASGGEKDGVNILYISDVSRIRIWNGEEVATN